MTPGRYRGWSSLVADLPDVAFFLPFSCNEKPQAAATVRNQRPVELADKTRITGLYRESATTLQKPAKTGVLRCGTRKSVVRIYSRRPILSTSYAVYHV
jgi:hypothetical protein